MRTRTRNRNHGRRLAAAGGAAAVVAPWSPADLSPALWYDDRSWPASGSVSALTDLSGNGYGATLMGGDTAGTVDNSSFAKPALVFGGNTRFTLGQPAGLVGVVNGAASEWTVFAFLQKDNNTDEMVLLSKDQNDNTSRFHIEFVNRGQGTHAWKVGSANTVFVDTPVDQPHTFGFTNSQTDFADDASGVQRFYVAGACVGSLHFAWSGSNGVNAVDDIVLGGWASPNAFRFAGKLLAKLIIPRRLLPHEWIRLSDFYYARFGVANPRVGRSLVWQGNSLSVICPTTSLGSIPEAVRSGLSKPLGTVHNLAIGGQTTDGIIADGAAVTQRLIDYLLATDGLAPGYLLWEGSNLVDASKYATECNARVAAGTPKARIAVATVLPRDNPSFNAARNAENTTIRGAYATYAGQLADVGANATVGNDSDAAVLAKYPDGVHLSRTATDAAYPDFVTPAGAALA